MIFPVYTSFETDSLPSKVKAIVHMDGSLHDTGDVTVSLDNLACHDGKELRIHDAVVSHDFLAYGTPYENVAWAYGYYEGCVNFEVNGDHRVEPDIMALNGQIIGGCAISVIPSGNPCGWIFVNGIVETISAGGQNLVLDCLTGDEFESGIVGDVDDDDDVDVDDLMALIGVYGSDCPACPEDLDDDSDVDVDDLMILLGNYGA